MTDAKTTPTGVETATTDVETTMPDLETSKTDIGTTTTDVKMAMTNTEKSVSNVGTSVTQTTVTTNNVETTDTDAETAATEVEVATASDELVNDPAAPQVVNNIDSPRTAACSPVDNNLQRVPVSVLSCAAMALSGKRYGTFRHTLTERSRQSVRTLVLNWKTYKLRTHSCWSLLKSTKAQPTGVRVNSTTCSVDRNLSMTTAVSP